MSAISYTAVGKLQKPHGIHGAFHFVLDFEPLDEEQMPGVWYIGEGSKVPYFLNEIRFTDGQSGLLRFEDIDNRDAARPLVNSLLYIPAADFGTYFEEPIDYSLYIGYQIVDTTKGLLGIVEEILEYPQQILAQISWREHKVLIPLADELIEDIDEEKKMITLRCPEGLLEL